MKFFKKKHLIRRYSQPVFDRGYSSIPYEEKTLLLDVQVSNNDARTASDGTKSIQTLLVFCDEPILTENAETQQKADRLWYQGLWYDCTSCVQRSNTILRHFMATFTQCLKQDPPPKEV